MMGTSDRGLGSPNMNPRKKREIQRKGGQASRGGRGGTKASHEGGNKQGGRR